MKRLNTKGFTLVELLAVIVILAIVVGITLVTVLPTIKDSKQKAFEVSAQIAADYLEKQYQLSLISGDKICGYTDAQISNQQSMEKCLKDAGLKPENYIRALFKKQTNGRFCVTLYAYTQEAATSGKDQSPEYTVLNLAQNSTSGDYYDLKPGGKTSVFVYFVESSGENSGQIQNKLKELKANIAKSSGCD